MSGERVVLTPIDGALLIVDGRAYAGEISISNGDAGIVVVEETTIDRYLYGIAEVPFSWPIEALRAQAIAARTYLAWTLERTDESPDTHNLDVPAEWVTVRGRVGHLPRAGMKMGDAFTPGDDWPKHAVYPSYDEMAEVLGTAVQPFVLLMDQGEEHGFSRQWTPSGFGPDKHYGYALQWFAMAAVLSGLLIWNHRKKKFT